MWKRKYGTIACFVLTSMLIVSQFRDLLPSGAGAALPELSSTLILCFGLSFFLLLKNVNV